MSASLKANKPGDHDGESCWKAVRMETGFNTYRAYMDGFCDGEPRLSKYLDDSSKIPGGFKCNCVILDIDENGSLSKNLDMKPGDLQESPIEILKILRNPPTNVLLRIFLIEPKDVKQNLPSNLIEIIGLGLRITPDFLKAYLSRNNASREFSHEVPLRASHQTIGRAVCMLSRNYLPASPSSPPVLLIMGHPAPPYSYKGLLPSKQTDPLAFAQPITIRPQGFPKEPWPWMYERLFRVNIASYQNGVLNFEAALFHAVLPLLETTLERMKGAYEEAFEKRLQRFRVALEDNEVTDIWKNAQEDRDHEMEQVRFRLKRWVRSFEHDVNDFKRYMRTQGIRDFESYEAYAVVSEEARECIGDALGLESELRDWLQLRVGSLALQETKKSIQISNLQIEESQRVTVLAFVYVPLNLATSIFGMNIQQLNRNGQPVWIFILTTILAVTLTFFLWWLVEQRVGYVRWQKQVSAAAKRDEPWPEKMTDHNFVTRLAILVWLFRNGRNRWTWYCGASLRVLKNEPVANGLNTDKEGVGLPGGMPVCDYVSMNIKYGNSGYGTAAGFSFVNDTSKSWISNLI